jgi:hypothetical protein
MPISKRPIQDFLCQVSGLAFFNDFKETIQSPSIYEILSLPLDSIEEYEINSHCNYLIDSKKRKRINNLSKRYNLIIHKDRLDFPKMYFLLAMLNNEICEKNDIRFIPESKIEKKLQEIKAILSS